MKLELGNWGDLGACVHTALRKCCDSTVTSLAYNLVHACDREWDHLLKIMHDEISKVEDPTPGSVADSMLQLFEKLSIFDDRWPYGPHDPKSKTPGDANLFQALVLAFRLFDRDEWLGAHAYLWSDK